MTYLVRPAHPKNDAATVLSLWDRNSWPADSRRYSRMYEANGPAPSFLWLATTLERETVGTAGLLGRRMKIGSGEALTGQAMDLVVDARHRILGPAVQLQRAVTASLGAGGLRLIYAFPNRQSEGVLRRAGYEVLGPVAHWTRPLRSIDRIRRHLGPSPVASAAAWLVDAAIRTVSGEWKYRRPPGVRPVTLEVFDERFDDLWQRACPQFTVIGDRSADYLRWRFGACPWRRYQAFGILGREERLEGYAVFYRKDRRVVLADVLAAGLPALTVLLMELSQRMRLEGAHALTMLCASTSWIARAFRHLGFYRRNSDGHILLYPGSALPSGRQPEADWHFTEADRDV